MDLTAKQHLNRSTAVALGMFDGVHIGHRRLIETTVELAGSFKLVPAAFTFSNHPLEYLGKGVKRLCSSSYRDEILRSLGIERIMSVPFDGSICGLSPEAFIAYLAGALSPKYVIAGYNYTFGAGRAGDTEMLKSICAEHGIGVKLVPPVSYAGESVSSSRIRRLIEAGDMPLANELLGREYSLKGIVCANKRIGRRIGFPTANISPDASYVTPPEGVYISRSLIDGLRYNSVTNIGRNPTVGGAAVTIETNIFDFDEAIYGQTLEIGLIKKIRDIVRFKSVDELKDQIGHDAALAKAYFVSEKDGGTK